MVTSMRSANASPSVMPKLVPVLALALGSTFLTPMPAARSMGPLPPGGTFFDDDGSVHEADIEAIAAAGITRGCNPPVDDLYCSERPVTRAQMAAFLARSLALPEDASDRFDDDDGSLFEQDIDAVAAAGITRGCGPHRYCPDEPVTRAQMAAFLVRALSLPGWTGGDRFADDDGSLFEQDIEALAASGVTRGCNPPVNDRYCPTAPVRRDQLASFLARALGLEPVEPPPRPTFSLAFTGDVLVHRPVWERAALTAEPFDFRPMFAPVASVIGGADVAVCHLETPLTRDGALSGYPTFNVPGEVAEAMAWAGYDGCSTASNHSFDQGVEGIAETLAILGDAGLAQAGMASSEEAAGEPARYTVDGVTVAHLSATWWLNGFRLPDDQPWLVQLLDVDEILARASKARMEGADVVVVSMHCCVEYVQSPSTHQREVAHRLIASPDVDLVVGHHAHVVQPIEQVGDEYIVHGLGNFLSAQRSRPSTQDGVIVLPELALRGDRWVVREIQAVPTWVEPATYRVVPAPPASWDRTRRALLSEGARGVRVSS